ncbi:hypothetical protein TUM17574_53510 [Klebsiella pneumoniae]|nr:hypothetical protein KAM260_13590 [Klebsiella pneumoniae]BDO06147.1 hypothetical protein KAM622c_57340 [Klebsiella quasipneumoniae subsp. quasipneumoniae]GJK06748.1 hypothetical protein TUM16656_50960 [Klebsiella pneumoniae]GJK27420.1 hypothetical protein TUM17555_50950 [Klebsiella pneumoniae]GJK83158.1 hypothetical protein TUM17566_52100 [Klebsiella pneumoniae]
MVRGEISRFPRKDRIDMPGSQTPPGPYSTRSNAPYDVAFRKQYNVGTREFNIHFVAQWLACQHPCQRFAPYLTVYNA